MSWYKLLVVWADVAFATLLLCAWFIGARRGIHERKEDDDFKFGVSFSAIVASLVTVTLAAFLGLEW